MGRGIRYQAMFGTAMPIINLPADYGSTNWYRIIEFRKAVFTEWMTFMCDTLSNVSEDFNVSIVFNPDIVSGLNNGYMTAAEATSVDVDDILQIGSLDTISMDPYWNAWNKDPSWYANFAPQFITAPHNQGKGSIFWVQAYLETQAQINLGLHAGEVTEAIDNSLGLGSDGIFIWAYDNFSQASAYDWPEYFDEFAAAVEPYLDRLAQYVAIQPVSPIAPNFGVTQLSPGRYQVQMDPNALGNFEVEFKNSAGIKRLLTFTVE